MQQNAGGSKVRRELLNFRVHNNARSFGSPGAEILEGARKGMEILLRNGARSAKLTLLFCADLVKLVRGNLML